MEYMVESFALHFCIQSNLQLVIHYICREDEMLEGILHRVPCAERTFTYTQYRYTHAHEFKCGVLHVLHITHITNYTQSCIVVTAVK